MQRIDYKNTPESDVVIDYIESRYKKGLYTLVFVFGLPGTGKSSTCIRLAELTSERLFGEKKIDVNNIVDSLYNFIKAVRRAKPGDRIVIEEISVLFPSRRAMAADNVAVARLLDTCRKKQVILFANAPIFKSIDSHMRALGHVSVETLRINKKEGVVVSKPFVLQTNPSSGKTYTHTFTRRGRDVNRIFTKKPNQDVWNRYEQTKDKFMDKLYESLEREQKKKQEKDMKARGLVPVGGQKKPMKPEHLKIYHRVKMDKISQKDVAKEFGYDPSHISVICKKIKKIMDFPKENEQNE